MEKMPNLNEPADQEINENSHESRENLLNNLSRKLRKLKLIGIVLGGAFLGLAENSSAQSVHEGTVVDSAFFRMSETQMKEAKQLSAEIDGLVNTLGEELKEHKVPVAELSEYRDDKHVSSSLSYNYKNIKFGAGGWTVSQLTGDTVKFEGGLVTISDVNQGEHGEINPLTKESITYDNADGAMNVDHYTNTTGEKYGGELLSFQYGDIWKDKNAVLVAHAKELHPDTRYQQNFAPVDFAADQESFKKLEHTLIELKDQLETAVNSLK